MMGTLGRATLITLIAGACISFQGTRDAKSVKLQGEEQTTTGGSAAGADCSDASECASGFCATGVCCDTACEGECLRCDGDTPGTCHVDVGQHCGAGCAGTCESNGNCNAAGACPNGFGCNGDSCATACASNADCAPHFQCLVAPDCTRAPELNCLDGGDDNGDGRVDCEDPTCLGDEVECVEDPPDAVAIGYLSGDTNCDNGYTATILTGDPGPNTGNCDSACSCVAPASSHAMSLDDYPTASDTTCGGTHGSNNFTLYSDATFRQCIYSYAPGITAVSINLVSQGPDTVGACPAGNISGTTTPPAPTWGATAAFCAVTRKSSTCPPGRICAPKQTKKHCALFDTAASCSPAYSSSTTWYDDFGADSRTCTACNGLTCSATPKTLDSVTVYAHSSVCTTQQYLSNTLYSGGFHWPGESSCHTLGAPAACSHSACWSGAGSTIRTFTATSSWSGGSCAVTSSPVITGGQVAGSGAKTTCCEPL